MKKLLFLLLAILSFNSCYKSDFEESLLKNELKKSRINIEDDIMITGKKREDPNFTRNIEIARKELEKTDTRFSKIKIVSNYKYVKITPLNEQGVKDITALKDFDVYYFPLDIEIVKYGNKFIDPTKDSDFVSFWVVVPIDFIFSVNIKEKVLEDVFLPFGTGNDFFKYEGEKELIYKQIEAKSRDLLYPKQKNARVNVTATGSLLVEEDTITQIKFGVSGTKYYVPIKGVKITARNFLTSRSTTTGNNGSFTIPYNFSGNIDEFTITWESTDFYLVDGNGNAAKTSRSSGISNNWVPNITKAVSPVEFRYSHVYRGAYNYYNLPTGDILSPPKVSSASLLCNQRAQMEIKVKDGTQSHYYGINGVLCKANIVIENSIPTASSPNSTFKGYFMFASISHELTHAKHWAMSGGMTDVKYCTGSGGAGSLAESYAMMCEFYLVNKEYSGLLGIPYLWNYDYFDRRLLQEKMNSYWANSTSSCTYNISRYYTPYFIDLIDSRNQFITNGSNRPNDLVSNYTAKFLEDCIKITPDNWAAINQKIKTPAASSPILLTPLSVQGNSASNIDYLYNMYKSL
ncbi:MAG: hypothetical protein U0V04_18940 [Spirosomataceae bacterium]|jgi:hypothetical protein